jgi:predicted amidohydrolase YtcJ
MSVGTATTGLLLAIFAQRRVLARTLILRAAGSSPLPLLSTQCDLDSEGKPDPKCMSVNSDKLLERLTEYDARRMTCKMHIAGEGSVRLALDVYEAVRQKNPDGPRHELAHFNAIHPGK